MVTVSYSNLAESGSSRYSEWTSLEIQCGELLSKTLSLAYWLEHTGIHRLAQTHGYTFTWKSNLKIRLCLKSSICPFLFIKLKFEGFIHMRTGRSSDVRNRILMLFSVLFSRACICIQYNTVQITGANWSEPLSLRSMWRKILYIIYTQCIKHFQNWCRAQGHGFFL